MMSRCFSPKYQNYKNYGGRGITVCEGWRGRPLQFIRDVWPRPNNTTIDRKNNDGNYSCGKCDECLGRGWTVNVRWATSYEQIHNRRNSVKVSVNGELKNFTEIGASSGEHGETIRRRVDGLGWTPEQAAGIESRTNPLTTELTFQGDTLPFKDMAAKHGLSVIMLHHRLDRGMSLEEALTTERSTRGGDSDLKKIHFRGAEYSLKELAEKHGQDYKAVFARINKLGWTIEQALGLAPKPPRKAHNKADLTPEQVKERNKQWAHTAYLNRKAAKLQSPPAIPPAILAT